MIKYLKSSLVPLAAILALGTMTSSVGRADECVYASCYESHYWYNFPASNVEEWYTATNPYLHQAKGWAYPGPHVPTDPWPWPDYEFTETSVDVNYRATTDWNILWYINCEIEEGDYYLAPQGIDVNEWESTGQAKLWYCKPQEE